MKDGAEGLRERFREGFALLGESIALAQEGFHRFRAGRIREAREKALLAEAVGREITEGAVRLSRENAGESKGALRAAGHFDRCVGGARDLADRFVRKIERDVLFSEKAAREILRLFEETGKEVRDVSRCVGKRGEGLSSVEAGGKVIRELVFEYATEHEERLVKGICSAKASSLFLDILECFRALAYHLGKAAGCLASAEEGRAR